MLTKESLQASIDLTALLMDRNLSLVTVDESPLENLAIETQKLDRQIQSYKELTGVAEDLYVENRDRFNDGEHHISDHTDLQIHYSQNLSRQVARHFDHARNVVLPQVRELFTELESSIALRDPASILNYQIKIESLNHVLQNSRLQEELSRFTLRPRGEIELRLDLVCPADDETLLGYLKTGSAVLDAEIETYLSVKSLDFVREVWNKIYGGLAKPGTTLDKLIYDEECASDYAFIGYLIGNQLTNRLPELPEMGNLFRLSEYGNEIAIVRDLCAYKLNIEVKNYHEALEKETLVLRVKNTCVYVNEPIYRKWIEDGGNNDVLFGMIAKNDIRYTASTIAEQQELFLRVWANQVAMMRRREDGSRFNTVRIVTDRIVSKFILTSEDDYVKEHRQVVLDRLNRFLNDLDPSRLEDINKLSLDAICCTIYAHTDADVILNALRQATIENPEISTEEAATIALIDYVSSWVADQLAVE